MSSRRKFLGQSALAAAALATSTSDAADAASETRNFSTTSGDFSLCGQWKFQTDPQGEGTKNNWHAADHVANSWSDVNVPHAWQVDPAFTDYRGVAWYRRTFDALPAWRAAAVRVEFEAVFHTATVWISGKLVGEHARKGYTAFAFDITSALRWDQPNHIAVRVDNAFNDHMLPRGRSSDWAHDGGIFRPVQLLITPPVFVERVAVDTIPDFTAGEAALTISARCRNTSHENWAGSANYRVFDDQTGLIVASSKSSNLTIKASTDQALTLHGTLPSAKLWHFDSPHLYRLEFQIANDKSRHQIETTFGVRTFEIRDGKFHLNGEPVRLMGVERMAGSNPAFGMAEPSAWIEHDHDDLKRLNCVFTRVHWPQDRRVLDYCDRNGILMQLEVPAWGPDTFSNMGTQPTPEIMDNGLEQLREMIERDRNHPSVVAWGLCNEIDGQNPPAYNFAKRMLEEARRLDPGRLCSYASNSLGETPERDVAGLMDFIETNEYIGTWQKGDAHDVSNHLDALHASFPAKPIVISEYGYCACTPDRPEGDERRIEILRSHDEVFRSKDFVGGAIFFCYNDYRTHVGDVGTGALQQRVHGVVDVYGAQKPSYAVLRNESSPVESLTITNDSNTFHVVVKTRSTLPSHTLCGYELHAIFYNHAAIPIEFQKMELPVLPPGHSANLELAFREKTLPLRVRFEIIRPTCFAAYVVDWKR